VAYLKGTLTVRLGATELLDDVEPPAAPDRNVPRGILDAEQIGLALYQAHRKTMYRKDVERLERHSVVSTEHVLIPQQIREVGGQSVPHACVLYGRDHLR